MWHFKKSYLNLINFSSFLIKTKNTYHPPVINILSLLFTKLKAVKTMTRNCVFTRIILESSSEEVSYLPYFQCRHCYTLARIDQFCKIWRKILFTLIMWTVLDLGFTMNVCLIFVLFKNVFNLILHSLNIEDCFEIPNNESQNWYPNYVFIAFHSIGYQISALCKSSICVSSFRNDHSLILFNPLLKVSTC